MEPGTERAGSWRGAARCGTLWYAGVVSVGAVGYMDDGEGRSRSAMGVAVSGEVAVRCCAARESTSVGDGDAAWTVAERVHARRWRGVTGYAESGEGPRRAAMCSRQWIQRGTEL